MPVIVTCPCWCQPPSERTGRKLSSALAKEYSLEIELAQGFRTMACDSWDKELNTSSLHSEYNTLQPHLLYSTKMLNPFDECPPSSTGWGGLIMLRGNTLNHGPQNQCFTGFLCSEEILKLAAKVDHKQSSLIGYSWSKKFLRIKFGWNWVQFILFLP